MIQSTLNVDRETRNQAQFIRIVEFDPATQKTRMFAYPHELSLYKKSRDAKIGAIEAINNTCFAIVEQGKMKNKSKKFHNTLYTIDISQATDLSDRTLLDGKALEYGSRQDISAAGIRMVEKNRLFNLRDYGWDPEKIEGLAVTGETSLAAIGDNDFGLEGVIIDGKKKIDMDDLRVKKGQLVNSEGRSTKGEYLIVPFSAQQQKNLLWDIQLSRPLSSYCPS